MGLGVTVMSIPNKKQKSGDCRPRSMSYMSWNKLELFPKPSLSLQNGSRAPSAAESTHERRGASPIETCNMFGIWVIADLRSLSFILKRYHNWVGEIGHDFKCLIYLISALYIQADPPNFTLQTGKAQ